MSSLTRATSQTPFHLLQMYTRTHTRAQSHTISSLTHTLEGEWRIGNVVEVPHGSNLYYFEFCDLVGDGI